MDKGRLAGIDPDQCPHNAHGHFDLDWTHPQSPAWGHLIFAHGAGAPMDSPFMQSIVQLLVARGLVVVRFEFPYMAQRRETGGRRPPDRQPVLLDCWRQVYSIVRQQTTGLLALGGKSMGGRMASLLADELKADALVCLGYPFHPPGKPESLRTEHLQALRTPTLIVQGERDPFGRRDEVVGYDLSSAIRLHWLAAADHDFKPLKRAGVTQEQHLACAADAIAVALRAQVGAKNG